MCSVVSRVVDGGFIKVISTWFVQRKRCSQRQIEYLEYYKCNGQT